MVGLIIAVALTIFLGLALILLLATGRPQMVPRLMEVARVQTFPATESKTTAEVVSSLHKALSAW